MRSLLKMLMSTRKSVMSMAMRPGTTSGGMRNEAHDVITNRPGDGQAFVEFQ